MLVSRSLSQILSGAVLALGLAGSALAQNPAQAERPDDNVIGSEDAELLIVEYASFGLSPLRPFPGSRVADHQERLHRHR